MINKIYEKTLKFIKENYLWLLFYIVFIAVMLYPLPYYIYTGGGIINIDDKIIMEKETKSDGSYHMCYVSEINATLPTYLLSYVIPNWDLIKKEEIVLNDKEDKNDVIKRDKIYLTDANQSAVLTAFKTANKEVEIVSTNFYILYIEEDSITDLKIGDQILKIDNQKINQFDDIATILSTKSIGDKINITILENNKEVNKYAIVKGTNQDKKIGIALSTIYEYETNPSIKFNFKSNESGPSGGLMLSLALYDKLVSEDITKGYKIAGTGTIDKDGNVGEIGGVKYKLKGAVDAKSDIFIVPNGNNYKECIKLKEKYNYDIKIIGVSTFEEAIFELKNLNK